MASHLRVVQSLALAVLFALVSVTSASSARPSATSPHQGSPPLATEGADLRTLLQCHEVLADLEWSWRVAPEPGQPMPARESVLPTSAIQMQIDQARRAETALWEMYGVSLDEKTIQAELNRIAAATREPERLAEVFARLGQNAEVIGNCFVRRDLARRLLQHRYDYDTRWHGELRQAATNALSLGSPLAIENSGATLSVMSFVVASDLTVSPDKDGIASAIPLSADDFHRERERLLKTPPKTLRETVDAFIEEKLTSLGSNHLEIETRVWSKRPFESWWAERSHSFAPAPTWSRYPSLLLPAATGSAQAWRPGASDKAISADSWQLPNAPSERFGHTAVWTGSEMIVWGGCAVDGCGTARGGRYNPVTDSWMATSIDGAPPPRLLHTAVWTGTQMIIWGGCAEEICEFPVVGGGRYDPATNSWQATSATGAPSPRHGHAAVWTGKEMLIWGGESAAGSTQFGARYDPIQDVWSSMTNDGAPFAQDRPSAIWTGREMIVWGGRGSLNTGGRYDPAQDRWLSVSNNNAPRDRLGHSAVWTGHDMIIWGGYSSETTSALMDGARYNPETDAWTDISSSGAPSARYQHQAVWTGREMLLWGGDPEFLQQGTGARYDPATDTWTALSTISAPRSRILHSVVWTGTEMLVWGGYESGQMATGGRYNPSTDRWLPTSGAPFAPRVHHSAVWTGTEVLIWGDLNTGLRYRPLTDSWLTMSRIGAPDARVFHSAVWTGLEWFFWSGVRRQDNRLTNGGGRYNPDLDQWTSVSLTNAPSARAWSTAVWTGTEVIVWGGQDAAGSLATGALYHPGSDTWRVVSNSGAPAARARHGAVWTGSEMVVWGGVDAGTFNPLADGGRYDPSADSWLPTNLDGAPSARASHSTVWTGEEMIVWGGSAGSVHLASGARYTPHQDSWLPTTISGAPSPRSGHQAVWTGQEMIIWGGCPGPCYSMTGGRYRPDSDVWLPTSLVGAPRPRAYHAAVWTGRELLVHGGSGSNGPMSDHGIYYPYAIESIFESSFED